MIITKPEWMKEYWLKENWWRERFDRINSSLAYSMRFNKLLTRKPDLFQEGFWYFTRIYEYPWVLDRCPPHGNVLDVGSNAQWHVALFAMEEVETVTAHYTYLDTPDIGLMNCWQAGWFTLNDVYERYRDKFNIVLGQLDNLQLIMKPQYFDTIYCLSTIEHVPSNEVDWWIDNMKDMLKPGGKMCFTVDYFRDYDIDDGLMPQGWNHDLSKHFDIEIPKSELSDVEIKVPPIGRISVYGFVWEKPNE